MSAVKKRKGTVSPEAPKLPVEGEMTIYRATELKQILVDAVNGGQDLEIDLSAVTEIDTAGVQLLMLAKKLAQSKQQQLHLTGHSPAVLEAFELLNLGPYFDALETSAQSTSEVTP